MFAWGQDEEEGAMFNQNMTKESIKLVLESIRLANKDKEEFLDLTSFMLSKGTTMNLKLGDFTLDYISIDISKGQQFSDNIIFIVQGKLLQFRQYKLRWQTDSANLLTLP